MFRRGGGRSKASADTLCQKCLKRGHYSYECTVTAQERPYKSRPSRTQQLLNPSLKPKLSNDVPNDLLRKKGLADEILAQKEAERRKNSGKRSRSLSSSGVDSVSTISTNRSRSPSSSPKPIKNGKASSHGGELLGKRGRRSVSSASDRSLDKADRNTRRRLSSFSPEERGRRRTRSRSSRMDISHDERPRRKGIRKHRSRSRSFIRGRGGRRSRSRSVETGGKRPVRHPSPRSQSRSPNRMDISDDRDVLHNGFVPANASSRGRWGASPGGRRVPSSRSRSRSPYPQRSPSPYSKRRASRSPSPYKSRYIANNNGARGGRRYQFDDQSAEPASAPAPQPAPIKERSLSPYSKRVALTRQMQTGH